jgi:hypothetical protein
VIALGSYDVTIHETLARTLNVKNVDYPHEALAYVCEKYSRCEIVLDSGDFVEVSYQVDEAEEEEGC